MKSHSLRTGLSMSALAEVYAPDVFVDDFAIDTEGRIIATTHVHASVVRIGTDRRVTQLAGKAEGLEGATAVALREGPSGRLQAVVVTNGGVYVPPAGGVETAKVLRLQLSGAGR
jgi:hypothetical protein